MNKWLSRSPGPAYFVMFAMGAFVGLTFFTILTTDQSQPIHVRAPQHIADIGPEPSMVLHPFGDGWQPTDTTAQESFKRHWSLAVADANAREQQLLNDRHKEWLKCEQQLKAIDPLMQ